MGVTGGGKQARPVGEGRANRVDAASEREGPGHLHRMTWGSH